MSHKRFLKEMIFVASLGSHWSVQPENGQLNQRLVGLTRLLWSLVKQNVVRSSGGWSVRVIWLRLFVDLEICFQFVLRGDIF